jgi:hypothetical protein
MTIEGLAKSFGVPVGDPHDLGLIGDNGDA